MLAFIANCFQTDGVAQSLIPQARGRGTLGEEAEPLTDAFLKKMFRVAGGRSREGGGAVTVVRACREASGLWEGNRGGGGGFEKKEATLEPQGLI